MSVMTAYIIYLSVIVFITVICIGYLVWGL